VSRKREASFSGVTVPPGFFAGEASAAGVSLALPGLARGSVRSGHVRTDNGREKFRAHCRGTQQKKAREEGESASGLFREARGRRTHSAAARAPDRSSIRQKNRHHSKSIRVPDQDEVGRHFAGGRISALCGFCRTSSSREQKSQSGHRAEDAGGGGGCGRGRVQLQTTEKGYGELQDLACLISSSD